MAAVVVDRGSSLRSRGLRPVAELAATKPHGTRIRYLAGCKCLDCRKANSLYSFEREVAVREGRGNPIVDASPARDHILALGREGVGYKTVADSASVPRSIAGGIRSGTRKRARRDTVNRILAVTPEMKADHALVPAKRLWQLISELLAEGYSKAALAKLLGYERPVLQFGQDFVTVRSEQDVITLYRRLTT